MNERIIKYAIKMALMSGIILGLLEIRFWGNGMFTLDNFLWTIVLLAVADLISSRVIK